MLKIPDPKPEWGVQVLDGDETRWRWWRSDGVTILTFRVRRKAREARTILHRMKFRTRVRKIVTG